MEQSQALERHGQDRSADGRLPGGVPAAPTASAVSAPVLASAAPNKPRKSRAARTFWLKQLHTWHWISAAISLIGMLLFAVTGITLNHAETIAAEPHVVAREATLPASLLKLLNKETRSDTPLPGPVSEELEDAVSLHPGNRPAEWSEGEVYVAIPGPGSDGWISIDRTTGAVTSEATDQGWISYFNDLHKGRNTGTAWFWFIDVFAMACVVFTLTGFFLLQLHARHRPSTWPLVAAGAVIPLIILLFFLHV